MNHEAETTKGPLVYTYRCLRRTGFPMRNINEKLNFPPKSTACLRAPKPNSHHQILWLLFCLIFIYFHSFVPLVGVVDEILKRSPKTPGSGGHTPPIYLIKDDNN